LAEAIGEVVFLVVDRVGEWKFYEFEFGKYFLRAGRT
jgi:hypothetical protein